MLIKEKPDEKKLAELDRLKDGFVEVQQTVSELRKLGKSTSIADVMLLEIPAKLTIAKLTYLEEDIKAVENLIARVRKEISDITSGSEFDMISALIAEAFDHLRKGEKGLAIDNYKQIVGLYRLLTHGLKKTVYFACMELGKRLENKNG
jgi:hypothetical protein